MRRTETCPLPRWKLTNDRDNPPARLLLVGAYRPLLKVLTLGLEEEGFAVDTAPAPNDGSSAGWTTAYDAIVLDVRGPRDPSLSLLRSWRQAGVRTPILLLAAPGGEEAADGWDSATVDDRLSKPFELEDLFARLRALVRRGSLMRRC